MVIAISVYHCITNLHELWVEFGRGKIYNTRQFTEYQTMEQNVTEFQTDYQTISASALPFFYALSGCDPTLSIFGKSKKTSDGWKIFPDITGVCKTCICAVKKWKTRKK